MRYNALLCPMGGVILVPYFCLFLVFLTCFKTFSIELHENSVGDPEHHILFYNSPLSVSLCWCTVGWAAVCGGSVTVHPDPDSVEGDTTGLPEKTPHSNSHQEIQLLSCQDVSFSYPNTYV